MKLNLQNNRYDLFQLIEDTEELKDMFEDIPGEQRWPRFLKWVSNEQNVKTLLNELQSLTDFRDDNDNLVELPVFYTKYFCDLAFAKNTKYCPSQYQNYLKSYPKCVQELEINPIMGDDGLWAVEDDEDHPGIRFFNNYKYFDSNTRKINNYSCNEDDEIVLGASSGGGKTGNEQPTTADTQTIIAKIGDKNETVGNIQRFLISKNFKNVSTSGNPDNNFGPKTQQMVKDFQKSVGLPETGEVNKATMDALQKSGGELPVSITYINPNTI